MVNRVNGQMKNQISTEYECTKCNGTGWEYYEDDSGTVFVRECSCGIRERQKMVGKLMFADIPRAFQNVRLDNFSLTIYESDISRKIIEKNMKAVKWWFEHIEDMKERGMGFYFYSKAKGSGKTRMAISIANELMYQKNTSVKFATSIQILNEIKASWSKENVNTEQQLIQDLSRVEVLIIDDFGVEIEKEWVMERFYQIINTRYINNLITIFTSNVSIDEINEERITNRIIEKCYSLAFPDESIRNQIGMRNREELKEAIS